MHTFEDYNTTINIEDFEQLVENSNISLNWDAWKYCFVVEHCQFSILRWKVALSLSKWQVEAVNFGLLTTCTPSSLCNARDVIKRWAFKALEQELGGFAEQERAKWEWCEYKKTKHEDLMPRSVYLLRRSETTYPDRTYVLQGSRPNINSLRD